MFSHYELWSVFLYDVFLFCKTTDNSTEFDRAQARSLSVICTELDDEEF